MASLSQQDVVNKSESTEAQPVDIPANNDTFPVPRGTSDNASSSQAAPGFTDDIPQPSIENEFVPQKDINSSISKDQDASQADIGSGKDSEQAQGGQSNIETEGNQATTELPDNENFEVGSVRSAGFEGSLGSDTDTMKLETSGGKDAVPKYSVRKPAGFKPLSVTKSFLAKASTAVLPIKTAGDKGIASPSSPAPGSATSTTRPRLVAKTLSSSRSAAPKSLNSGMQKAGGDGPDPNQVWNRNRVQMAPQATPKHMTDEELRQQYGIQLASRPLEGADSNQAKWADLEDEDEDWAPETLEWSDGTKINLAPADSLPPSILPAEKASNKEADNAEKAATAARPGLGPKATVLKLGGATNQPKSLALASGIQSSSKNPNEKLTLVAKASPALPAKSPWAQLPPVEKVSPVAPPIQQSTARLPQREGYTGDVRALNGLQPAREIAADDYSRFSANAAPRELFNSQNGRYEPAPENRRGSMKRDAGFRAPSVLQRPSPSDTNGPTEQSPMFQARSAQDTAAWRRRRASSNVSNDNGGRRMSMSRPGLDNTGMRDSVHDQPNGIGHGPYPDNRVSSPAISHGFSHGSQQSPVVENASIAQSIDRQVVAQTPQTPNFNNLEHEVAQQKKLMRERAEAAMKRRKEEEAKEEAEKRERLRLKLQALEPKEIPAVVEMPGLPTTQPNGTDTVKDSPELQKPVVPPKPPAPSANGEPQQYGLIKMHASNQTATNVGSDGKLLQTASSPDNNRGPERFHDQGLEQQSQSRDANENNIPPKMVSASVNHQLEKDAILPPMHRMLGQSGPAGFQGSAWNSGALPSQSSNVNVWAAPVGSQKSLGNGDFQPNITQIHLPPVSSQQYPQHLASSTSQHVQPQPIGTPRQAPHSQTSLPPAMKEHAHLPQHYSTEHVSQPGHQRPHAPLPTAPKDVQPPAHMQNNATARPLGVAAWGDFARNASSYDAQKRAQLAQEHAAAMAERERSGLPNNQAPIMRETWTQVAVSDESRTVQSTGTSNARREPGFVDETGLASTQHHPIRSRYQDLFDRGERTIVDVTRPQGPLTPPPEEDDHPVFIGGAQRPKVRLPGSIPSSNSTRPTPIVRLPVPDVYNKHPVVVASNQAPRLPLAPIRHQPLVNNSVWQERFNGLLGNGSAAHRRLLEVPGFSTSKEPLEQLRIPRTPVSLPPAEAEIVEELAMKSVEEEIALLEEGRDFGSRPPVNIPPQAPIQSWNPSKPSRDFKRFEAAKLKDAGVHGATIFLPSEWLRNVTNTLSVKLPTMQTEKIIPFKPTKTAHQQRPSVQGGRGAKPRNTSMQHHSKSKGGDSPVSTAPSTPGTTNPRARPAARGGASRKSSGPGHGNNWVNSAKRTPPAPAVVH